MVKLLIVTGVAEIIGKTVTPADGMTTSVVPSGKTLHNQLPILFQL